MVWVLIYIHTVSGESARKPLVNARLTYLAQREVKSLVWGLFNNHTLSASSDGSVEVLQNRLSLHCSLHSGKSATIYLFIQYSKNRIMALVYVRSITHSTMYQKSSILLARTGVWKISSVACGFSSIKTDYSDYSKSLISRINEVYVFFNKIAVFY